MRQNGERTARPETVEKKRALLRSLLAERDDGSLNAAEQRLWDLESREEKPGVHSFSIAYDITGKIDAAILERAVRAVARRHTRLRSRLEITDTGPRFVETEIPRPLLQLRELLGAGIGTRENLIRDEARRPLDPRSGPPWRCLLITESGSPSAAPPSAGFSGRPGPPPSTLFLQFHHIIADRWSVGVFVTDLARAYTALLEGREASFDEEPAERPAPSRPGAPSPEDLDFWKGVLTPVPESLALPGAGSGNRTGIYAGDRVERDVDPRVADGLRRLAGSTSETLFPYALAAFTALLHRHTGQEDLLLCTPVTGRHRSWTRKRIGYFNNILPLRLALDSGQSFRDTAAQASRRARDAYAHQDVPFQSIAGLPGARGVRLTRVLFAVQNVPGLRLEIPGIHASHRDVPNGTSNFDLGLFLEESEDTLHAILDFKTSAMNRDAARRLLDRYVDLLEACVQNPATRLGDLPDYRESGSAPPSPGPRAPEPEEGPRDLLEERMLGLWRDVLENPDITADASFFDVGGDSMQAATLFQKIEDAFGEALPLATLLEAPTPRAVANRLGDSRWVAPWQSVVPIRPEGSRAPLFCVHGGGGNIVAYRVLADCLDPGRPVYGLQAKGLRSGDRPLDSVEEMADHYLQSIRKVRPRGPYLLGGHSLGAVVAFEISQRLIAEGEDVPLLIIFDHPGPDIHLTRSDWIRYHIVNVLRLPGRERFEYVRRHLFWRFNVLRFGKRSRKPLAPGSQAHLVEAGLRAIQSYAIRPYPKRIALFRARQGSPRILADPQGGWGKVARGGVDVVEVPGTHLNMFREPQVRDLGAAVARCLSRLET